jgi:hypothetical protein
MLYFPRHFQGNRLTNLPNWIHKLVTLFLCQESCHPHIVLATSALTQAGVSLTMPPTSLHKSSPTFILTHCHCDPVHGHQSLKIHHLPSYTLWHGHATCHRGPNLCVMVFQIALYIQLWGLWVPGEDARWEEGRGGDTSSKVFTIDSCTYLSSPSRVLDHVLTNARCVLQTAEDF